MSEQVWLVTGCSSGIGHEFVAQILSRGDKVIATARNGVSRLASLAALGAATLDLDVAAPFETIEAKIKEAIAIYGRIDVLVNNAGYGVIGVLEELTQEKYMEALQVNLFGPQNLTRALLPHFRSRSTGTITFMNSIYAWISTPCISPYAISKSALDAYATSLQAEVKQFGIDVVSFELGHFRTPFVENADVQMPKLEAYGPMVSGLMEIMPLMVGTQPGDVGKGVKVMIDAIKKEGSASGKKIPWRLPLGPDALEVVRRECKTMLEVCDQWEDVVGSTDRDGPREGQWAEGQPGAPLGASG